MNKNDSNLVDFKNLEESNNDIRESHKGLNTTSTNMLVDMLANTDKIVSTDKRWNYEKHYTNHS